MVRMAIAALSVALFAVDCRATRENHLGDPADAGVVDDGGSTAGVTVIADAGSTGSFLCKPAGDGPFPAVYYNHGGYGDVLQGDLEGTCVSLAQNGYIAYAKRRSSNPQMAAAQQEVADGHDYLLAVDGVDTDRLGAIGFSRGGLLTLDLAEQRVFAAVVLEAPAPGGGDLVIEDAIGAVGSLASAEVLLLVAENDDKQADHVGICNDLDVALTGAGIAHTYQVYPCFGDCVDDDGHELFFQLRDYWTQDVLPFLDTL